MLQESLFGRVEPKRTFNVEANLLSERQLVQLRVVRKARRGIAFLSASLVLGAAALPAVYQWQINAGARARAASKTVAALERQLSALGAERDASVPRIADSEMVAIMGRQSKKFIEQLILVLNATPSSASISGLKADVMGGELTLSCSAEAERFESMREFLAKAATGPDATSTVLASSRRSETLGEDGVAFDFVKKAKVGE